ncbi:MAG: Methionine synthase [Bacteroidetes bacterium ADurb.Bin408]|nr:MAG: Methionine synthase [Bacteroidetes bacterium ADurb.Bin408]
MCLSDFISSGDKGNSIGLFLVSVSVENNTQISAPNDYIKIIRAFLADGIAEAMSEWLFNKTLQDVWQINKNDMKGMQAIKPAVGYPCYPDHSEKQTIFDLLQAEKHSHIKLTENFAMIPVSSVCGLYLIHPDARYFSVGKVFPDQMEDYAKRKNIDSAFLEKMLSTNIINP